MTQYSIHLNNFQDLHKYASLLEKIPFSGYVVSDDFMLSASEILLLFPLCPIHRLNLVIPKELPEKQAAILNYLKGTGLLSSNTDS